MVIFLSPLDVTFDDDLMMNEETKSPNSAKVDDGSAMSMTDDLLARSLNEHLETVGKLMEMQLPLIGQTADLIYQTLMNGKKVLFCGNGGSAADAQHIAAELVGRYETKRKALPGIALNTDTSALTALSNDYGFEEVFARQVLALANEGDLLIAISTSGKSPNVLKAVEAARVRKCQTIGLTGMTGEPLASLCDLALVVAATRTARVQEAHITIGHLWCEVIDSRISAGEKADLEQQ